VGFSALEPAQDVPANEDACQGSAGQRQEEQAVQLNWTGIKADDVTQVAGQKGGQSEDKTALGLQQENIAQ
jgi:hypothetical protein